MNSIKKKLFFQIGSLAIILIGFMVLANTYLLQPYYINKEKKQLYTYYKKINNFSSTDYTDSLSDLISIEDASNIDILIYNSEGDILYASKSYMKDKHLLEFLGSLPNKKGPKPPGPPVKINHEEPINDKVRYIWVDDLMSGGKSLVLTGQLDNDYNIDLRLPLMSIKKSISLSNRFLLFTGIPLFLIGIISAYFLSKSFTRPILQMNKATNSMKQLDFSTKCTVLSNDEIGQLASSINDMSIELEKTIKSLNTSNINLQQEIAEKTKIDKRRKQLLNNVSHELKTPLSLMQGYAEGLKLNVAQKHNRTDFYCDVIVDEVKK
uniref:HAMP domain-containing protein n=1 Tax=Vallitalea guaymasensis TaxID=1185412 RepID=UPI00272A1C7A